MQLRNTARSDDFCLGRLTPIRYSLALETIPEPCQIRADHWGCHEREIYLGRNSGATIHWVANPYNVQS